MTGPHDPYRDEAARRVGEALQAQARGRPVSPPRSPAPPTRGPGRIPPPARRPAPPQLRRPEPVAAPAVAAPSRPELARILWPALIVLLGGALLGGAIALVSVLLPGALPAIG